MSGGYSPIVHLACHKGARRCGMRSSPRFLPPSNTTPGLTPVGSAAGIFALSEVLTSGALAGTKRPSTPVSPLGRCRSRAPPTDVPYAVTPLWWVKEATGKAFLDFQNDVTAKDIPLAAREGYSDVELAKRYTTNGMATDQGKLSNINAIGILAESTGRTPAEVGTTTFRPFYTPVTFGAFVGPLRGKHFQPIRKTPLHDWCESTARCSWRPARGCARHGFPSRARIGAPRRPRGAGGAGSVGLCDVRRSARSTCRVPTPATSSTGSTRTRSRRCPSDKARNGLMLRE